MDYNPIEGMIRQNEERPYQKPKLTLRRRLWGVFTACRGIATFAWSSFLTGLTVIFDASLSCIAKLGRWLISVTKGGTDGR